MTDRVRIMLLVVAVLATIRFVVAPWFALQAEANERLTAVTRQLDRAEAVAAAGEKLVAQRDAFAGSVELLASRAPVGTPLNDYRLTVQRQMTAVAEAQGLKLSLFEWVLDDTAPGTGLDFGRVRLQLEGSLEEIAAAHVDIEAGQANVIVRDVRVTISRGGKWATAARATFELDVYYRPGDPA